MAKKSWTESVLKLLAGMPPEFTTQDVYRFEKRLQARHPENNNVRAKIRQQLQVLRDRGVLAQGKERGQWVKLVATP